ncbi:conjugal transfer protein TraB [Erwinia psidii]|uniref:TraB/GumN family protein n=1 Tax=Erwinia psidii TaxID=69224 RepID=UPI00226BB84C|nr:TraB/GumN family protein [Erwinia psidii]MCX8962455.1 conjugal transfer protein TraB [Erwinia psidii]MCX8963871.1 conjugal transfer protein TraB [Erwinia psidii]
MAKLFCKLTSLLQKFSRTDYTWPAEDITLGHRQLHMVGSIHMGTPDMAPLPAQLLAKLECADALIVEADITSGASPFSQSEQCNPLAERLSGLQLHDLYRRCDEMEIGHEGIDSLPGWQIALMLQAQQAQRLGLHTHCGIDFQLLEAAHVQQKKVIELEGPETQLALLNGLPNNGLSLLEDTLTHWHTNARLLQTMISWWLESPPTTSHSNMPNTFNEALNDVLMLQRNQRWCQTLRNLPAGRYVVAVGALHLYGEGNLLTMLEKS